MDEIMQVVLRLVDLTQNLGQIGRILLMVVLVAGLLNCFLGYKLLRLWVTLVGLIVGGIGGFFVGYRYLDLDMILNVILAGVAALVVAAAAFYIYKAGIFLLCGAIGMVIGIYVIHPRSSLAFFICLMIAVGVGALGIVFVKPIVIVTTAVQGGLTAGLALVQLLYLQQTIYGDLLGIGIVVLGLLFQILTNLHHKRDDDDEDEDYDRDEDQPRDSRRSYSGNDRERKGGGHRSGDRNTETKKKRDRIEQW